jgi:uncharacterized membrane protein
MIPFIKQYRKLLLLMVFTAVLHLLRVGYCHNADFAFLLWNMFLALLPLYFSYRLRRHQGHKAAAYCWAGLWLLFFPNAAYIITDLLHLHERPPVPRWFDLVLLFSAATSGLMSGLLSLRETEQWLRTKLQPQKIQAILFLVMLLNGFGIYLGRFLRWNSWDLFIHPFRLGRNIGMHIADPGSYLKCWTITLVFGTWLYLFYNGFKQWNKA